MRTTAVYWCPSQFHPQMCWDDLLALQIQVLLGWTSLLDPDGEVLVLVRKVEIGMWTRKPYSDCVSYSWVPLSIESESRLNSDFDWSLREMIKEILLVLAQFFRISTALWTPPTIIDSSVATINHSRTTYLSFETPTKLIPFAFSSWSPFFNRPARPWRRQIFKQVIDPEYSVLLTIFLSKGPWEHLLDEDPFKVGLLMRSSSLSTNDSNP